MDAAMSDASNNSTEAELQAWREVHHHLSKAVLVAKEAVAVAKAQRRYWCEELVANLTPEGKPINTSTWKKSTRKTAAKRKQAGTASSSKRRKSDASEAVATAHHGLEAFSAQAFGMPNTNEAPTNISQLLNNNNNGSVEQVPAMTPMQVAQSGTEAQGPIMTPMQVAQRGGKVFPPPVRSVWTSISCASLYSESQFTVLIIFHYSYLL